MRKYIICLTALLLLAGCSTTQKSEKTASSSSSIVQKSSSQKSTSSTKASSKGASASTAKVAKDQAAAPANAASTPAVTTETNAPNNVQVNGTSEMAAPSQNQVEQPSQPSIPTPEVNVGAALLAGDFSSVAGVWQDEFGNQLVVDAAGNVHVAMAAGDHIPEVARENLTRDLFVYKDVASWDGTVYSASMGNEYHTSGLPSFMVNPESGTVSLVNEHFETYTGTFSRIQ
ncbi:MULTISPECIES: DUF6287 domain-containing protein [unclassified Streptococcus]|uniref:DUF6287 domain-containing protein n=1 Tax=unclassified Streptococcus TaxID=2608887 RepID=UPI0018A8844B|nr:MULTISPECIES: DUF6287 domain-containing protein [unclassified Streptococcus]MBF8970972.1 membrane lipoprotein lipid attachment site-containing protein [Streptococcus sp. NLN76]MBG9367835.1 membrane lipoprotein lipid attachment site-containing protein [Streptococcus sp. NLN64]